VDGKPLGTFELPGIGTLSGLEGGWDSNDVFFSFSSFNRPPVIFRNDLATGARTEWWRSRAPFDPDAYEVNQVWFESRDGTRVPMFVAHRKHLVLDGKNPVFLTGYGGFDQAVLPSFSANTALFLERGGVWASANLRGGSEFGESWHRAGMFERKQNVFDDFIAAAQWLIANHYTSPRRLAIGGSSNGGLLVGAAMTQHPELFKAVFCSVPLLDMLRYQDFLAGRFWVSEYGSAEDSAQFRYLRSYSPYHHVTAGTRYPAVLLMSGDSDTRVAPFHARKMTARLQAATGSAAPVLLHYDSQLGHSSGGKPVARQIEDDTDRNLFLFWQLGMTGRASAPGDAPELPIHGAR
jgi:prolyl oligopeptidase